MPEPQDHAQSRGNIESILRKIPGFQGYLEREYRRESDQLQRDWLATRLERSKKGIDDASQALAAAGQIDLMPQFDRLRARLDKLIGRIRGAMQGYSGFFDLVQVDETMLDNVYEFDIGLMDEVDGLAAAVEALPQAEAKAAAVDELLGKTDELDRLWNNREDILKGLK